MCVAEPKTPTKRDDCAGGRLRKVQSSHRSRSGVILRVSFDPRRREEAALLTLQFADRQATSSGNDRPSKAAMRHTQPDKH